MIRYFGFIIILAASYGIGALRSKGYRDRYREVDLFRSIVLDMANTIRVAPLSIGDICGQYMGEKHQPFSTAFAVLKEAAAKSSDPCDAIWDKAVAEMPLASTPAQKALYRSAISAFLLPDKDRVTASLELVAGRLSEEAAQSREDMASKAKMAQKLSVACGVFAVILLW
ncbi:MAG: stage III sporulation protein AB [Eubacteriaceae bacterium]|jgi:stage III sporulation protein AB|nr:stage III sporulation protein AB [Eubacteriaceae bacterium]